MMPGQHFAFRHERLQDFLCAYSLLPEKPTLKLILGELEQFIEWCTFLVIFALSC